MIYTVTRTRHITERYRVIAPSEEEALQLLEGTDELSCPDGVEQLELSTEDSVVDIENQEEE